MDDAVRELGVELDGGLPLTAGAGALLAGLASQLRHDVATPWVWPRWSLAALQEDDADRPSVSRRCLGWLEATEAAAGAPATGTADPRRAHHAGALHTYGYLCSTLPTKHGWKRTRWVGGGIAAAAGVAAQLLSPLPPSGTLLANATTLAARLLEWDLGAGGGTAAMKPTAVPLGGVTETIAPDPAQERGPIEIRLSLFAVDARPPTATPALLVYPIVENGIERLITMFDVDRSFAANELARSTSESIDVPIVLRFNALVSGVGPTATGRRRVEVRHRTG